MNLELSKTGIEIATGVQDIITLLSLYHYEENDELARFYILCIVYDLDYIQKILPQTLPYDYKAPDFKLFALFPSQDFENLLGDVNSKVSKVILSLLKENKRDSCEYKLYDRIQYQITQAFNDHSVLYKYYEKF